MWSRVYVNDALGSDSGMNSDNRSDDENQMDTDRTPGPDLGAGQLYIWRVDSPAVRPVLVPNVGNTVRMRVNFNELTKYAGTQVSAMIPWNFATSIAHPAAAQTFRQENTYAATDNRFSVNGDALSLTIDLQPSAVANFTLTGFNPGFRDATGDTIDFSIQGTGLDGLDL